MKHACSLRQEAYFLEVASLNEAVWGLRQEQASKEKDDPWHSCQSKGYAPAIWVQVVHANVQALSQQNASHNAELEQHRQSPT